MNEGTNAMPSAYRKLAVAIAINAVIMYFVTYAMIETVAHFYFNINRLYMTLMMVAPMVAVMLVVMAGMFPQRALNAGLHAGAAAVFVVAFVLARQQVPVGNEQFLRSMIPHHSSAILMCKEAEITDPDSIALCEQIIQSQREEIAQMEKILARLGRGQ